MNLQEALWILASEKSLNSNFCLIQENVYFCVPNSLTAKGP